MGLAERRLAEKIKVEEYAPFLTELHKITGYDLPVEIDWSTFIAYDEYSLTRMNDNVFNDLLDAFKHICQDQLGKDAVSSGIKIIKVSNTDDIEKRHFSFENKEINMTVALGGGSYSNYDYATLIKEIESKL
jgi:hypothetical protein